MGERTAQLYMKIARSGHSAETVAALGLKAAEKALTLEYCFHQPLFDGDEETRREWYLFALFLAKRGWAAADALRHIDWLGRHDFKTVEEWLTQSPKWVSLWGGKLDGDGLRTALAVFRQEYDGASIDELDAKLQVMAIEDPANTTKRRRRKSATVADLGGSDV
jgi:hypothetical protein